MVNNLNNLPDQYIPSNQLFQPAGIGDEQTKEQLKISRLAARTCQLLFKACGCTQIANVFSQCRLGIIWALNKNGFVTGDTQNALGKDIHEVVNSPNDVSHFISACRNIMGLVSIPLGIALKNEAFSGILKPILENEFKNMMDTFFYLKISGKNAYLQSVLQKELMPGASLNETNKFMVEKAHAALMVGTILTSKYELQVLSISLKLAASLAKAYILYLEKNETSPIELFDILKFQSELTLTKHLNMLGQALEQGENFQEVYEEMSRYLNLLSTAENDSIYFDLLSYKDAMNQLFSIYLFDLGDFNQDMDQLLLMCEPLITHREKLEQAGIKLLQNDALFLNEQRDKLLCIFYDFQEKLNPSDFKHFINPEFEKAIDRLNENIQKNKDHLEELTINPKFGVTPFSVLSMDEQKALFDEIVKETSTESRQEITTLVKTLCREV